MQPHLLVNAVNVLNTTQLKAELHCGMVHEEQEVLYAIDFSWDAFMELTLIGIS